MGVLILRWMLAVVIAFCIGKGVSKLRLPAILGWLIAGMVLGPYAFNLIPDRLIDGVFYLIFTIRGVPVYLAFLFGGIALATAPAPALSIVQEFKTKGPVTKTLIPMVALDDMVGVAVFFTTVAVVARHLSGGGMPIYMIPVMIFLPLNFMLMGMAFSATFANMVTEERLQTIIADFNPFLGGAVIVAKKGFEWAGEMRRTTNEE